MLAANPGSQAGDVCRDGWSGVSSPSVQPLLSFVRVCTTSAMMAAFVLLCKSGGRLGIPAVFEPISSSVFSSKVSGKNT